MYLKTQKFLILGVSKSGIAVTKYALLHGAECYVYEELKNSKTDSSIAELINLGAKYASYEDVDSILSYIDVVVLSPGVPINHRIAVNAKQMGKRIIGELEFGFLQFSPVIVGITGTNGKTTTSILLETILSESGTKNKLVGNVGVPLTAELGEIEKDTVCVCEVSSFQLESVNAFCPHISCVINVAPDHLERHYNMENYVFLKKRIFKNQRESEFTVLNYEDSIVREFERETRGKVVWVSTERKVDGGYLHNGKLYYYDEFIIEESELRIQGKHNVCDALFAICSAKLLGVKTEHIVNALKSFKGVKHRVEYVCEKNGVVFYNDSKATNTASTISALNCMKTPTVLILGGSEKGEEYYDLFKKIKESPVTQVILTGDSRFTMLDHAGKIGCSNLTITEDFNYAVKIAKIFANSGDAVLLSPACASFDRFSSYEERGNAFVKIVEEL